MIWVVYDREDTQKRIIFDNLEIKLLSTLASSLATPASSLANKSKLAQVAGVANFDHDPALASLC